MAVSTFCAAFDITFAYRVSYDDNTVGFVASAAEIDDVNVGMQNGMKTADAATYLSDAKISLSVAVGSQIEKGTTLANKILSDDKALSKVSVLLVDGVAVCGVDVPEAVVEEAVEVALDTYSADGCDSVAFAKDVKVEKSYYPTEKIGNMGDVMLALGAVEVITVKTVNYTEEIVFPVVSTESTSYVKGYKKVTQKGVPGEKAITAVVTTVNGVETAREILSETVTREPVEQKELIGTASAKAQKVASRAMFIWPAKKVPGQVISSYWGDGRNHRAIDIASPTGTPIYAAMGGVVTTATYKSDYGYYVVIDHGKGYETVYAHASKLNVSVGQVVSTGETIALVGSTGQSTGSHLHFEVRINGTRVDPLKYIK